jgi:general secretion pathway protein A
MARIIEKRLTTDRSPVTLPRRLSTAVTAQQSRADSMYEEFYGFVQPPFTLAPDPRFLYRSESHDEAITLLLQAIRRKEGFIVLTGDIGTGKTTICRALMEQLDTATFTSLILNPFLSVEELLREVLLDFGVVSREAVRSGRLTSATKHELISTLHEFLLSLMAIKGSAVFIIDEAQHLSPQVLEQIRIISNLETNQSKLLQIVLVGQLNLLDVLESAELRQLDQRISIRAALKPLTRDEVDEYIKHRLRVAGGSSPVQFEPEAVDLVHVLTTGVPRIINLLCDRALMAGAAGREHRIGTGAIEEAARNLGLKRPEPPVAKRRHVIALTAAALAAVILGMTGVFWALPLDSWVSTPAPSLPTRPALMRGEPGRSKPIPTQDLLLPPAPAPPTRPRPPAGETPDDQVGRRRPPLPPSFVP